MRKRCLLCGGSPFSVSLIPGIVPCPTCHGAKYITEIAPGFRKPDWKPWREADSKPCPICYGRGGVTCPECRGSGYIDEN